MVFNYLTAHAEIDDYSPLLVAPLTMAESFLRLIRREQEHAQAGRPAHIMAKMNALLEPSMIQALYQASQAGVEIDLIVRGLCILRPGVKGLSERIRVRSIVGPFPRALAHLPLRQRRQRRNLHGLGRLDAAQPVRALRGRLPGARRGGHRPHPRRDSARLHGRHDRRRACSSLTAAMCARARCLKNAPPFSSQDFLISWPKARRTWTRSPFRAPPNRRQSQLRKKQPWRANAFLLPLYPGDDDLKLRFPQALYIVNNCYI